MAYITQIKFNNVLYDLKDLAGRLLIQNFADNTYTKLQADSKFLTQHQSLEDYLTASQIDTRINTAKNICLDRIESLEQAIGTVEGNETILETISRIKEELTNPSSQDGLVGVQTFLDKVNTICNGIPNNSTIKDYVDGEIQTLNDNITSFIQSKLAESGADVLAEAKAYTDAQIAAAAKQISIMETTVSVDGEEDKILEISSENKLLKVFK